MNSFIFPVTTELRSPKGFERFSGFTLHQGYNIFNQYEKKIACKFDLLTKTQGHPAQS